MTFADSILTENGNLTLTGGLINSIYDYQLTGWALFEPTCTYASSSTFTIAGDYTTTFVKGTKLKFTNSSLKYATVSSSSYSAPNTTVTIIVNTDYTIANTAITGVYVSRADLPAGFPDWFNWSPSLTGFSSNPTNSVYRYRISGKYCTIMIRQGSAGTSNATSLNVSLPINAATVTNAVWGSFCWQAFNNGSAQAGAVGYITSGGSTATLYPNATGSTWTSSGNKYASITIEYEI